MTDEDLVEVTFATHPILAQRVADLAYYAGMSPDGFLAAAIGLANATMAVDEVARLRVAGASIDETEADRRTAMARETIAAPSSACGPSRQPGTRLTSR